MANQWNIPGIPHKGWALINVIDVREDGRSADETDYEVCMMCGNEKIRYVHVLEHPDVDEEYIVGCVCAEKMTNDYYNPRQRENALRNKTNRRINWLKRNWKRSGNGNPYLKLDGHILVVFYNEKNHNYGCILDGKFGKIKYPDMEKAKIGLFKKVEDLKEKGEW